MNPELPQVKTGAETAPQIPGGVEYHPETAPRGIETERGVEQILAVPVEGQPIAPPTTLPPVTSVVASPTSAHGRGFGNRCHTLHRHHPRQRLAGTNAILHH